MTFSCNGLVVKETSVGETDKSLVILAQGHGKISAWARGAKKMRSPLLHSSSLFSYSNFTFTKKKDSLVIKEAVLSESFMGIRSDIENLALASYIASVASEITPRNQEEDNLLRLTLNCLYALSKNMSATDKVKAAFELRSVICVGFLPELMDCVICSNIAPLYFFSPNDGGILCEACKARQKSHFQHAISNTALDALRYIAKCDMKKLLAFEIDESGARELSKITQDYLLSILSYKPKTLSFYEQLKGYTI